MKPVREYFDGTGGKILLGVLLLIALGLSYFSIRSFFGVSEAQAASASRWFIDAETLEPFRCTLKVGDKIPVQSPSGRFDGYEAELCYWTKDGGVKPDPTPVLLNIYRGSRGPTFCPDCGRLVVERNPVPATGMKPPPLKDQYEALVKQKRLQSVGGRSTPPKK